MKNYAWEKPYFTNREEAARLLVGRLEEFKGENPLVLAIPRGAVGMGRIIADALGGDLDLALVKKVGSPGDSEIAVGAASENGSYYAAPYARSLRVPEKWFEDQARRLAGELKAGREFFTPGRGPLSALDRIVIIVDDGIATGSTVLAAVRGARAQGARKVVVATAVSPQETVEDILREADGVKVLSISSDFHSVAEFYEQFPQVTEEEVARALAAPARGRRV